MALRHDRTREEVSMFRLLAVAVFGGALTACAIVPTPLQGDYAAITPRDAAANAAGQRVRWGGEIIKVDPSADATCFEILARSLDSRARPTGADPSLGRFIACHGGFHDPEEFERGREMTVVGQVTGIDHGKVGDFDYAYPHVAADAIYLWPLRPLVVRSPRYDPWMWGYGPWGGFSGPSGPYWGPTIIVRDHPTPRPPPRGRKD
jgi:outer membrane lipoprotein